MITAAFVRASFEGLLALSAIGAEPQATFYVPENADTTIVDSTVDSLRFTLTKTLRRNQRGHLESISSFVDPDGNVMGWHDFGNLEGPGWAANAVGGAYEIYIWGKLLQKPDWQQQAISIEGRAVYRDLEGNVLWEEPAWSM